jgi:Flp pilus assembly CpaF family ATPase
MSDLYCTQPVIDAHVERLLGSEIHDLLAGNKAQEISVNANGRIFVDDGQGPMFAVEGQLTPGAIETAVRMLAAVNGIWLAPDAPFLNTVLACGARFSAALPPVADGSQFSIRTHVRIQRPLTAWMTDRQAEWLKTQIAARKNIIVAGATNAGKTSMVNAMLNEVPDHERLVIIEDAAELQINKPNFIRRLADRDNREADMKRQVFEALRQRPDRIIVSEVRGAEARDMIEAMLTGHSGCFSTVHANSAAQTVSRLARLAECGEQTVREALHTILFLKREEDGRRHLAGVEELQ